MGQDGGNNGDGGPQKGVLSVVFVTLFLDLLGFGILIPIQPFYAEHFGAAPRVVTLLTASYSLMQFVFAPMWGSLSDRIGRRPVILISILFGAAGFVVFGFASSLWMLFAARMIAGFGNANIGTVQAVVADVTTGKDRARGMGVVGAAFGLGFVFGPVIGYKADELWGPSMPAFISAGLALLNWILALVRLPETKKKGGAPRTSRGFIGLAALGKAKNYVNVPALLLIFFVFTVGFSLMETSLSLFLEHTFVPADQLGTDAGQKLASKLTGILLFAVGITSALVQGGLIRQLRGHASEKLMLLVGAVCISVSFIAMAFIPDLVGLDHGYAAMFPAAVVLAFGSGIFSPSQSSLLSRSVGGDDQGEMLGLGQSMSALGRIAGPAMSGTIFEAMKGGPFLVGAALVGLGAVIAITLKPPPADANNPA